MLLDKFNCKPKKLWIDEDSEFYNRLTKLWLQDKDIEK